MGSLQDFATLVQREQIARLHAEDLACEANLANAGARVVEGKKYDKVDVGSDEGGWGGRFMVERATGAIFGIKGYGKIHRGHAYGTLETVSDWHWGGYSPQKRVHV